MKAKIYFSHILQIALLGASLSFLPAYAQDGSVITNDSSSLATDNSATSETIPSSDSALENIQVNESSNATAVSSVASDNAANAATEAEASTAQAQEYGLEALWAQGDLIARATLIIMVIMSAATWYVLVTKLIQQQVLISQSKKTRQFWNGKDVNDGLNTYKEGTAFRSVAEDGIVAAKQHSARAGEKIELSEWLASQLQRSVERVASQLQTGLSLLATVGSCSPFVGLFGTVWGIYHALIAIGLAGQASIDKVAGPVGEALIMTAIGLFVAVPAVLGYNWLVRRNKVIMDSMRDFAADVHANISMGVRGQAN